MDFYGHEFSANIYRNAGEMSRALYRFLCQVAKKEGQSPEIEVWIRSPEEAAALGYGQMYLVCWEAGPHDWAVPMANEASAAGLFAEAHHGFMVGIRDIDGEAA